MARFVLVHGAFAGGWCWELLAGKLVAAGHEVQTLDLPGSGEDRTPVSEVTLDACAERVCQVLAGDSQPAVLVGHSMGGAVVTQAAARCRERVATLVYVCAFAPADGQSVIDLTQLPEGADDQVQANLELAGDPPVATLARAAARAAMFACATDEQAAWAEPRLGPQPAAPFVTPVSLDERALEGLRRAYVVCLRDRAIPPTLQRRMIGERGIEEVAEIDTDHWPFMTATDELARLLDGFARPWVRPPPRA